MKIHPSTTAPDFAANTIDGKTFKLSDYRGSKILLSFFRNGACAMCNLRVHELIQQHNNFAKAGLKIVAVFESSAEDMLPFVGKQKPPFVLLSDPEAKLYSIYGAESSEEKVNNVIKNNVAHARIGEAAQKGFNLIQQANSNFFRLPAEFLIDENFIIQKSHYSNQIIDHMELDEVLAF